MNSIILETRVAGDHMVHLPDELPVNARIRIQIEQLDEEAGIEQRQPRTALGRKLLELRRAHCESGGQLLSAEELDEEMRLRRGGVTDD